MVQLDLDKVELRYATGINKCILGYPTALDVLYESCIESVDNFLFSLAKMENRYEISDERISEIIKELLNNGYIEQDKKQFKIIKTPWD